MWNDAKRCGKRIGVLPSGGLARGRHRWSLRALLLIACLGAFPVLAQQALSGGDDDYDALLAMIGDARIVMLGEATHGSLEFYRERARLTRKLVAQAGFDAVILEAPWEPSRCVDAYLRDGKGSAEAALREFRRFPRWLWRNREFESFVDSLRGINAVRGVEQKPVRLLGMDLYSVPESAEAVRRYVADDPAKASVARARYACFTKYRKEPMRYGYEVAEGSEDSCAEGALAQLNEIAAGRDMRDESWFAAWQSARVVQGGEAYYRALYREGEISWNWRERHLAETVSQFLEYLGPRAKVVVWAHNSHVGDARATSQSEAGEVSLGQLLRERFGDDVVLVGFSTYRGDVRAAPDWGRADRVWRLRPALDESWHAQLHRLGFPSALLIFRGNPALAEQYEARRLERVVGVMYVPSEELSNHYRHARVSREFDAVVHIDVTRALPVRP